MNELSSSRMTGKASRNLMHVLLLVALPAIANEPTTQEASEAIRSAAAKNICHMVGQAVGFYVACKLAGGNDNAKVLSCYRDTHFSGQQAVAIKAELESDQPLKQVSNGMFLAMSDQSSLLADTWIKAHDEQIGNWLLSLRELRGQAANEFHMKIFSQTTVKANSECLRALAPPSLDSPLRNWGDSP